METTDSTLSTQSYRELLPAPQLSRHVSCVWIQHVSPEGTGYEHRTAPDGSVDVSCDLRVGAVRVAGPQRAPVVERLQPGASVVGIRFRPGLAPSILGLPASELVDLLLDLDGLWGRSAALLGEKLAGASSVVEAVRLLEEEMAARSVAAIDPDSLVEETVRRLQPWSASNVGEVASALFVSPHRLRQRCLAAVGYGPKTLQRILRFQGFLALSQVRKCDGLGLARLAALAGYADQAHLTRECSRLTGLTPRVFLEDMWRNCGASHDHTMSFAGARLALRYAGSGGAGDGMRARA